MIYIIKKKLIILENLSIILPALTYQVAVKSTTTKRIPAAANSVWKWASSFITRTDIIFSIYFYKKILQLLAFVKICNNFYNFTILTQE